jgi:uncharacterized protein (AIM24 family)
MLRQEVAMAEWYVAIDGKQVGPLPEEQVAADLRAGKIDSQTLVFTTGMSDWAMARDVPGLAPYLPAARPAAAPAPAPARAAEPSPRASSTARSTADTVVGGIDGEEGEPSHSIAQFLAKTAERDRPGDIFELEGSHMLEAHVNGRIWSKLGAMVAYRGDLKFVREGAFEGGLGRFVTKMVTGEAAPLTKIEGRGIVYLADAKKNISVLRLDAADAINVNGNDVLAFEDSVNYHITMHRKVAGMLAGGLFSLRLTGPGLIAIVSHGAPLTLRCTPTDPVITDPNATVAWSGSLAPEIKTDISLRSLIGRGGGEAFQMQFRGDGFVVVQPYEEVPQVVQG